MQSDNGRHKLKVDFFTIFEDVWVEEMEFKIILPEGCSDIKVDVPYPHERVDSVRFTYLDSELNGGRPVITLRALNTVEEHDGQIIVSYSFSRSRMLVEPLMLVGSFFLFFLVCSVASRLDANLGRGGGASASENTVEVEGGALGEEADKKDN